ncbi:MAG TPA: hypothetical protein VMQ93_08710 [Novosphingobium sp.]|nr:hypothetical protein [Novosphingobium sp.]
MSEAFTLSTADPRFDPHGQVQINGYSFVPAPRVEWRPMSEAPTDGRVIGVKVGDEEKLAVWWHNFDAWRELADDFRSVGKLIEPTSWREATAEEKARG